VILMARKRKFENWIDPKIKFRQSCLDFFIPDMEEIEQERINELRRKKRSRVKKKNRIARLMQRRCDLLLPSQERFLNRLIKARVEAVRDSWSPEQAYEREQAAKNGLIEPANRRYEHDGRVFSRCGGMDEVNVFSDDSESTFMQELLF
jgi:hypothetical protein